MHPLLWDYCRNAPADLKIGHGVLANLLKGGRITMTRIWTHLLRWQIWRDTRGQDMVEYALLAGFIAVAAGAVMPPFADSISTIFSKIDSLAENASAQ